MNKAEAIKSKIEKADMYLSGFQVNSKPKNIWDARNLLFEVKSDLENLETVKEAWEVIKKEYNIETAEYLKADLDKLVKYESLNLKIGNILKIDLEELVEHVIVNGLDKPQKVVIPKFVADWWECLTDIDGLFDYILKYQWNENSAYDDFVPNDVLDWIFDNNDSFVLALRLITGELDYEVEKEKLYRVELPFVRWDETLDELKTEYAYLHFDVTSDETHFRAESRTYKSDVKSKLTEQQIKSIDERYWAFAVEVEDAE